jgi:muramoyltetrapeptide carboxypeptidase
MKNPTTLFYITLFGLFLFQTSQAQRKMITPEFLQKGDTIGILATARKVDLVSLKPAIKLLESWGLHV